MGKLVFNGMPTAPGPWDGEPDSLDFIHMGFSCAIRRNAFGCWAGYVGLPADHPWSGRLMDDLVVDVHGGLTFAGDTPVLVIGSAGSSSLWWIGFDCEHAFDASPYLLTMCPEAAQWQTYRPMSFALMEVESMADQAALAYVLPENPKNPQAIKP